MLSAFFAGISGGLSAINFEIVNAENVGVMRSGGVLLATFIGGTGYFLGPVPGAICYTFFVVAIAWRDSTAPRSSASCAASACDIRAVLLPQRGAALDVGEQERHRAGWQGGVSAVRLRDGRKRRGQANGSAHSFLQRTLWRADLMHERNTWLFARSYRPRPRPNSPCSAASRELRRVAGRGNGSPAP